MKCALSVVLIIICVTLWGLRAHADRAPEVDRNTPSASQPPSERVKQLLIGEWRGAGVTLKIERSGSVSLSHSRLTPQRPQAKREVIGQAQSDDQRRVGLWWLTDHHGAIQLCLYLQLTARCYSIQMTPHKPQRIWIRLGRTHLELTRRAQADITAPEE